jgi:hypothetical protein
VVKETGYFSPETFACLTDGNAKMVIEAGDTRPRRQAEKRTSLLAIMQKMEFLSSKTSN